MVEIAVKDVLVRKVDVSILNELKRQAKLKNRSLQAELQVIFRNAAARREPLSDLEVVRKIRASNTKVNKTNSIDLLHEDRRR